MKMRDHIRNTLKTSKNRNEGGWLSSYQIAKDAKISRTTALLHCSEMLLEGKVERKQETVKNVMRISWRIKP